MVPFLVSEREKAVYYGRTYLLYISNGKANDNLAVIVFKLLINGRPYFKPCGYH